MTPREVIAAAFYDLDHESELAGDVARTWRTEDDEGVRGWYRNMAAAGLSALAEAGMDVVRHDEDAPKAELHRERGYARVRTWWRGVVISEWVVPDGFPGRKLEP